ncbi:MAG: helix-turn-helix transcriptional regulator [Patescibacteria group bacterium]
MIGEKIQKLRQSRGMTQKELATFLGYSESFISYVEKGERKISISDLQKIAKIFAVDLDFLIEKPQIAHFRFENKSENNNINYDEVMRNFRNFIDEKYN